jgi:hypothetical protein
MWFAFGPRVAFQPRNIRPADWFAVKALHDRLALEQRVNLRGVDGDNSPLQAIASRSVEKRFRGFESVFQSVNSRLVPRGKYLIGSNEKRPIFLELQIRSTEQFTNRAAKHFA